MKCKQCKQCGQWFKPRRKWQAFCTKHCRYQHHNDVRSQLHASTRILGAIWKGSMPVVLLIPNFLLWGY